MSIQQSRKRWMHVCSMSTCFRESSADKMEMKCLWFLSKEHRKKLEIIAILCNSWQNYVSSCLFASSYQKGLLLRKTKWSELWRDVSKRLAFQIITIIVFMNYLYSHPKSDYPRRRRMSTKCLVFTIAVATLTLVCHHSEAHFAIVLLFKLFCSHKWSSHPQTARSVCP